MNSEVVAFSVAPLSQDYLSKLPHHVTPSMNLHREFPSDETSIKASGILFKSLPYSSSLPIPLSSQRKITREVVNGIDPTTKLIRDKLKWQMKKEKIMKPVCKDKESISGKVIKRAVNTPVGNKAVVPRGVVLLAQHLDRDPDPCFSGVSNWYFTGGTLATLAHNQNYHLLQATHSELSCSKIVDGNHTEVLSSIELESNDPIQQIVTCSGGVAVRQKSCVNILSVSDSQDAALQLNKVFNISNTKHAFLSVAVPNDETLNQFSTLSNNGVLNLWDLEYSKKCKSKVQIEQAEGVAVSDRWGSLQYLDSDTLLLTDRCCLHVLDVRAGMREKQLACCPKKFMEACEELSYCVCSCIRDNIAYSWTSHQALCLDLRFGFCQRWTHMMASPPFLGFTQVMHDNHELVCAGSQILSDCVTIVNTWKGEESQSIYMPSGLPSPAYGLHLARKHGLCLDPSHTQRCIQSMTGLTYLPTDRGLNIVRQSATADIFVQNLSNTELFSKQLSKKELAAYCDWSKPTLSSQQDPETITVTAVRHFKPFLKALSSDLPIKEPMDDDTFNIGSSWQLSKKYLEDCVDMLAGKILAVWEVEEEEEWTQPVEEGSTLTEQDPSEKVLNWLGVSQTDNIISNDRNFTDVTTLNPTVTSTPYPPLNVEKQFSSLVQSSSAVSMYISQPLEEIQQTPVSKETVDIWNPSTGLVLSPTSSVCSEEHQRKRQKVFVDSVFTTPPKQKTVTKKIQSSAKKFIPGF